MSTKTIQEHKAFTMTEKGLAAQGSYEPRSEPAKAVRADGWPTWLVIIFLLSCLVLWPVYFLAGVVWFVIDFVKREQRGEYTGVPGPMVTNSMPGMTVLDPYKNWR